MKCGACGRAGLRSTSLAWVPAPNGDGLERRRVCADCAGGALVVVLRKAEPECLSCREPARFCAAHAPASSGDAALVLVRAGKKIRSLAMAYAVSGGDRVDESYARGRRDGLEQAADVLDAGDFG